MKVLKNILIVKSLLILTLVYSFSIGCSSNTKRLKNDIAIKDSKINELENEKNQIQSEKDELSRKIRIIKNKEIESNRIKSFAKNSLTDTEIEIYIKDDGVVSLTLPTSYFDPGKVSLKKSAKSDLTKISFLIKQHFHNKVIRIEGHTDNQPIKRKKDKFKTNWELSTARAISVLYYFINECGVNPENIYIAGFGEHSPIADNNTKEGRNQNRRVEIVIIP